MKPDGSYHRHAIKHPKRELGTHLNLMRKARGSKTG
jgi:hypothetical protein